MTLLWAPGVADRSREIYGVLRVLVTNGHLNVGGVEQSLISLLHSIDYSIYSVDLLLFEGLGDYIEFVPEEVKIINWDLTGTYGSIRQVAGRAIEQRNLKLFLIKLILTCGSKLSLRFLSLLKKFRVTKGKYDYAIAYRVGMPAAYVAYAVDSDEKYVWWHHGEFDYDINTVRRWSEEFSKMDHIVCVSEYSRELIKKHFPHQENKLMVVPNMINSEEIHTNANEFNPYKNEKAAKILVSVGRLSREKHMIDCVFVANGLKNDGIDFQWYLIGDGDERAEIEKTVIELDLRNQIILIGSKKNPYPYIKNADLFVHPSYVESQGIAVLEAMALGVPCVVVKSNGTDEFVVDGVNAIQAEQSVDSLYEKVKYAIEHELDFSEAEKKVIERYRPKNIVSKIFINQE